MKKIMHRRVIAGITLGLVALVTACTTVPNEQEQAAQEWNMAAWHHVTVGVADLDAALGLWVDLLGFEVRARRVGADAGLASLWNIAAGDIENQALIATPGTQTGLIHLVQFNNPDPPVREGAEVFDLVPKNLDIYAKDLPARIEELCNAGMTFRTDTYSDVTAPNGTRFLEIHMYGHDATNIVLLETVGNEEPHYTSKGFAGVGPLISIVPDAVEEQDFYVQVLGLDELSKNLLVGPDIEKMIGLRPGSGLDVRILGQGEERFGLTEIVNYQGVEGTDRYPLAKPKALGTLHVSYVLDDLAPLMARLSASKIAFAEHEAADTLFGDSPSISFDSSAGLRIEAHQR